VASGRSSAAIPPVGCCPLERGPAGRVAGRGAWRSPFRPWVASPPDLPPHPEKSVAAPTMVARHRRGARYRRAGTRLRRRWLARRRLPGSRCPRKWGKWLADRPFGVGRGFVEVHTTGRGKSRGQAEQSSEPRLPVRLSARRISLAAAAPSSLRAVYSNREAVTFRRCWRKSTGWPPSAAGAPTCVPPRPWTERHSMSAWHIEFRIPRWR